MSAQRIKRDITKKKKKNRKRQTIRVLGIIELCLIMIMTILWQNPSIVSRSLHSDQRIKASSSAALQAAGFEVTEDYIAKYETARNTVPETETLSNSEEDSLNENSSEDEVLFFNDLPETGESLDMVEAPKSDSFHPHSVAGTEPANYISLTEVLVNDSYVTDYEAEEVITFEDGGTYTDVEGIVTFRGNNFRSDPTFGTADIKEKKMNSVWSHSTGALSYNGATWTGSGWTGQPLMEKWSQDTKQHMDTMYDWAKEKEDLVEVIYACMDGYIYFLDLETGERTRDDLYLGWTFKGSGALDPRGYPILYVGAGYDSVNGTARVFIVNLLDGSTMYTFGNNDTFSLRGSLSYFDSSALVDAETDTLIYPGENGILYRIKLNTAYDQSSGTLSIDPDPVVKWHYNSVRNDGYSYWLGMEDSASIYGSYLFVTDNGGNLMCIDINTMDLIWVQDTLDDSNSSPVLSIEDDHLYLYVSTSFRLGWRSYSTATVPIWKIDAETGEIIWQKDYTCYTEDGVSGGVQSTIALGQNEFSDYIYVTVARTGAAYDGVLACINKNSGEVAWEHTAYYAWSSPVCVYNEDGSGVVLYASCNGNLYMLDGLTGETLDVMPLSDGAIEASPAVYDSRLVIGTRDCKIWGVDLF